MIGPGSVNLPGFFCQQKAATEPVDANPRGMPIYAILPFRVVSLSCDGCPYTLYDSLLNGLRRP
jgi:hypothetical protein